MKIQGLKFKNHPILNDLDMDFSKDDGTAYDNIVFVGENGCGKTSILYEISNYQNSEYIVDKPLKNTILGETPYESVFIAQDIKSREMINSISEAINGGLVYESKATELPRWQKVLELREDIFANSYHFLNELIKEFDNDRLQEVFKNQLDLEQLTKYIVSLVKIDQRKDDCNFIDSFSSGEQELLLRLLYLKGKISNNTDFVLIDEPETSLHPKWQLKIFDFIKSILLGRESKTRNTQLFIATHSENILKSAINDTETLILRVYKEYGIIKSERISAIDRRLDNISFSELQYLIFGIASTDYHNLLFAQLQESKGLDNIVKVDKYIEGTGRYIAENHQRKSYGKTGKSEYNTLPVYIRNKIHHPENHENLFTEEQLAISIKLLRDLLDK